MSQSWTPRDVLQEEFDKFFARGAAGDEKEYAFAWHWFKKGDRIGVQTGKRLEREKILETLKRIRELTEYQYTAWGLYKKESDIAYSAFNQRMNKDILELIDYLLKDLDK